MIKRNAVHRLFSLILISLGITGCQIGPPSDRPTSADILAANNNLIAFDHQTSLALNSRVYGVKTNNNCEAAVLFIHGTPGSWSIWQNYLKDQELLARAEMIAIDRPGFGQSSPAESMISIAGQAQSIINASLAEHGGPFILVGHSYGGPIQIQIAQDFPENLASIVILAGAIDPELHYSRWYHHLGNTWIARQFMSPPMQVATDEMLSLQGNLEIQASHLDQIGSRITLIQGGEDWLVPPGNADYAKEQLSKSDLEVILLPEQNHFLPWREFELVKSKILEHLGESSCQL